MTGSGTRAIPFVWLAICPLIVGIARGGGLMILRPNEMLLFGLLAVGGFALLRQIADGTLSLPSWRRTDGALLILVFFGSVIPLLLGYGRGIDLAVDDVLYAFVLVKCAMLYGAFRIFTPSRSDLPKLIWTLLATETIVAVIALLQAKNLLGANAFLAAFYDDPFEGASGAGSLRASSTIASAFGLADSMAMALGLSLTLLLSRTYGSTRSRNVLVTMSLLFLAGLLAAGSFSGVIGVGIIVICIGALTGRLKQLVAVGVPASLCGAALLWQTIASRLEGFSSYRALPKSWLGRLENLETFFWPEIFSGWNWLFGVRPAARVAAPESWRTWVYIESGYTWLLWIGGWPMLMAFVYFVWCIFRDLLLDAPTATRTRSPLAVTALASTAMIVVIMMLDPHLTVRGCADLYFPLIALALGAQDYVGKRQTYQWRVTPVVHQVF